jgi:5-methylcytosine-specific restriction endonuclease McrA
MNHISKAVRQRKPRLKLRAEEYAFLPKEVLNRDGWRCQDCGSITNLQVHHIVAKSLLGADVKDNLVTLCAMCHAKRHGALG